MGNKQTQQQLQLLHQNQSNHLFTSFDILQHRNNKHQYFMAVHLQVPPLHILKLKKILLMSANIPNIPKILAIEHKTSKACLKNQQALTITQQYFNYSLKSLITHYQNTNTPLSEKEIWFVAQQLVFTEIELRKIAQPFEHYHLQNVFITIEGKIKIYPQPILNNNLSTFCFNVQKNSSKVEQCKKSQKYYNSFERQLGKILFQLISLKQITGFLFNSQVISQHLSTKQMYSNQLKQFVYDLLLSHSSLYLPRQIENIRIKLNQGQQCITYVDCIYQRVVDEKKEVQNLLMDKTTPRRSTSRTGTYSNRKRFLSLTIHKSTSLDQREQIKPKQRLETPLKKSRNARVNKFKQKQRLRL